MTDPAIWVPAAVIVFLGAVVRGYTGFGSGMIWVSGLSLLLPPIVVVPSLYLLDALASGPLLIRVRHEVDWRSLRWLLAGALVATPVGLLLLVGLPATPVRIAIALTVLAATACLWRGFVWRAVPGPRAAVAAGLLSGFLGGGTGIGGPPAILFYFASPAAVGISRASAIAYFFGLDLLSAGMAAAHGLYGRGVLTLVLLMLAPALAGTALGHRLFRHGNPAHFRPLVMLLLAALSFAVLLRAVFG